MFKHLKTFIYLGLTIFIAFPQSGFSKGNSAQGQELYKKCLQCHGQDALGQQDSKSPRLANQFDWYLSLQMEAFKNKTRVHPSGEVFQSLSKQDMDDLATYLSSIQKESKQ